jgi:peptidoglycan/LPS O-acetylase OafA/YrhL
VNNNSYPDIFFGLKGGLNNFGIVTNFNVRALPQTLVYGGVLTYVPQQFAGVIQAMVNFQTNNKDPKAQIIASFVIAPGQFVLLIIVFYDAPTAPNGIFDAFLALQPYGSLQTLSYLSFIQAAPVSQTNNLR